MMRPATCLCLLAALGSGLYLYQEKHRSQMLDRQIGQVLHGTDQARERINLLKAEWALLNEPERLQGLAAAHLSLQSLAPTQFAALADLPNRLPPVNLAPPPPAMDVEPIAAKPPVIAGLATPLPAPAKPLQIAAATPPRPAPVAAPAPVPPPVAVAAAKPVPAPAPKPAPVLLAAAKLPLPPHHAETLRLPEPAAAPVRPVFAPIVPAYSPAPVVAHPPVVQNASATTNSFAPSAYQPRPATTAFLPHPYAAQAPQPVSAVGYAAPAPFVGSALGMASSTLAAPVPVGGR